MMADSEREIALWCSLLKEHQSYKKEVEQQTIKVDKLVADGAEEWDIKNAVSILIGSAPGLTYGEYIVPTFSIFHTLPPVLNTLVTAVRLVYIRSKWPIWVLVL